VYDLSTLITLTGGDTAGLNELLMPLLGSLAQDRALLAAMQHHTDFAKLHDLAHRVKGGARMVKAQALIACCETLERVCERGDRDALAASVEAIGSAMDGLHHSLGLYIK
jgi:two-component system sensor histidine kinase EvgS